MLEASEPSHWDHQEQHSDSIIKRWDIMWWDIFVGYHTVHVAMQDLH